MSLAVRSVIVDRWFEKTKVSAVVEISAMVALTALGAQMAIYLPFTPVPITMQTFVILLGAAALGAQRAAISQIIYLLLAIAGLPILADGKGGLSAIFGATSGYLLGFIFASLLVGHLANRYSTNRIKNVFISYLLGSIVIYFLGALGLIIYLDMSVFSAIMLGITPFIIGDLFKAIVASLLLPTAWAFTDKSRR